MSITKINTPYRLDAPFTPMGDQPGAIRELTEGLFRGDRFQTLLGATGTGKSVGFDDPVFVVRDGRAEVTPIGPLIDQALAERPDAVRIWGDTEELDVSGQGVFTQAYDPSDGSVRLAPVGTLIRHQAPAAMYRLTTDCGREVTLTGDHNLWVLRDGRLVLIETADARPTDSIPVPERLLGGTEPVQSLDLLERLAAPGFYVHARQQVLDFVEHEGTAAFAQPFAQATGQNPYAKLFDMRADAVKQGGIAVGAFGSVLDDTGGLGGRWDRAAAQIGPKNGALLPLDMPLTPELLYLVGLYVAEGHAAEGCVLLASRDDSIRDAIRHACRTLDLHVSERASTDLQISSRALSELLRTTCGSGSAAKHLPPFWPALSDLDLGRILQGYFDGDGTVERASAVTATTASETLAGDLCWALLRFGVWARRRRVFKRATNSDHTGAWYWTVTVSGQDDLQRFHDGLGFGLARKQEQLAALLGKKGNTNVDVVPICGAELRALRLGAQLSARSLGERAGVSRSAVQLYENGDRRPSRVVLKRLVGALREEATRRNVSQAWWTRLDALGALAAVRWASVAAAEPAGYAHEHVYDLSVPGPETFLAGAGGLFVHNTYSISNVIQNAGKPVLVISHNKTLAAQLFAEFRQFFPHNAAEFFISYYDYYQPEAYIVSSDQYIEKDFAINEEIDRLRLRATSALVSGRKDVVIVASVSCIYGLGNPEEYKKRIVQLQPGTDAPRDALLMSLIDIFYTRNDVDFKPGTFRVRGDTVEIFPAYYDDQAFRVALFGDEVEKVTRFDPVSGKTLSDEPGTTTIYPAKHFVTPKDQMARAIAAIEEELRWRLEVFRVEGKLVEAQRLEQRTMFDIEMMKEIGYCSGIENYSRHMDGRQPGTRPFCLLDYFKQNHGDDWLLVIDESHATIPQVRAMYNGDRSRKLNLVEHGFRLPSALDNRPLTFEEFEDFEPQTLFVSATPADYELEQSEGIVVEQIIRPTGILDPEVEVRPVANQIDDLLEQIRVRTGRGDRVLVTTLTKRMSEDLTEYLDAFGIKVRYLHSDIDALERVDILRDLRLGEFDVLIGVNLLREGLDLPEVSLVAILDADKEGFLALRALAHPDGRPRGAQRRLARHPLRRPRHRLHAAHDGRDRPPPRDPEGVQRRARHHAADHPQVHRADPPRHRRRRP